jgi:rubredoxin
LGKARALKLGIVKGVATVAKVALPQTFKCPICKFEMKAYDVAVEAKETGKSAEEIVGKHIMGCIGSLKGSAQCPDCGKNVRGKDFEEHMKKEHPIK